MGKETGYQGGSGSFAVSYLQMAVTMINMEMEAEGFNLEAVFACEKVLAEKDKWMTYWRETFHLEVDDVQFGILWGVVDTMRAMNSIGGV